jgi:glycosyltransferase involved in cell wall biosynthesis
MPTATQPTRVVFAAHAFPRGENDLPGSFLLRLAVALEREGFEVRAVAPAARGLPADDVLLGIPVHRYRYAPRRAETLAYTGGMHRQAASPGGAAALAGLVGAGALAVRRAGAAADLVHAHWWFPGGVQALLAGRRPLVTTVHGTDLRLARSRPAARAACARVLRASAVITTVSTWLRDEVAEFAPDCAARAEVAPMPVDDAIFSPGAEPRDELLFVGRLDGQKGAEVAIRAAAGLRGAAAGLPLRVVGTGPLEADLRRLAAELGVAERLRWESGLTQARLADRYRRAAALLVPGAGEGFGLVAVEGQLSGAPVVAAASGGLLDVVADASTGWTFPPGDPAALAKVVEEVVEHPERAAEVADAARRAAAERFSTAAAASTYAALYRKAVGAQRAERPERARRSSDRLADAGADLGGASSDGGAGGPGTDAEPARGTGTTGDSSRHE